MAWNFNGYEVGTILRVGSKTHDICAPFGSYSQIAPQDFVRLPEQDRKSRVEAFYSYLSNHYNSNIKVLLALNPEYSDRRSNNNTCKPKEKPCKVSVSAQNGKVNNNSTPFVLEFAIGEECTLQASALDANWNFGGWYVNGVKDVSFIGETYKFVVATDVSVEARYVSNQYITINGIASAGSQHESYGMAPGSPFTINASSAWTASVSEGWIKLGTTTGGGGSSTVYVDVDDNLTHVDRVGTVTFALNNGHGVCTLTVKQEKFQALSVYIGVSGSPGSGKPLLTCCVDPVNKSPIKIELDFWIEFIDGGGSGHMVPFAGNETYNYNHTIEQGEKCSEEKIEHGREFSSERIFNVQISPNTYNGLPINVYY